MRAVGMAAVLIVALLAGAGAGYIIGAASRQTVTSFTTVTKSFTVQSPYSECGSVASCSATNPSGIVLSMELNTTSVRSNGSLAVTLNEFNPTQRYINMSTSDNWYLTGLPSLWVCYSGSPPYGVAVFRGYYTLQNVSSARDIINLSEYAVVPSCLYGGNKPPVFPYTANTTGFAFKPNSSYETVGGLGNLNAGSIQFDAINSATRVKGVSYLGEYSLWSSAPAVYTIAVGDEWGDLALAHFSVVAAAQGG